MQCLLVRALWLIYVCFSGVQVLAQTNRAVSFNGEYAYLKLPSHTAIKPTQQLTLELFAWEADWTAEEYTPTLAGNTQHTGYAIAIFLGKLYGCVLFDSLPPHNLYYNLNLLTPGWHHFAVTYDGQSSRLLVDGEVVTMLTNDQPTPIGQPDSSILFMVGAETRYNGEPYMHPAFFYKGRIDDLRIWDIAKTPEQIRAGFGTVPAADDPHLMASFAFDSIVNQRIPDQGRYQLHADTVSGPELVLSDAPPTNLLIMPIAGLQPVLLLLCCGILIALAVYMVRAGLYKRLWLAGFALFAIITAVAAQPALYEWITPDHFVPFWTPRIVQGMYLLSLACLLQFFRTTFATTHLFGLKQQSIAQFIPLIPVIFAINVLAIPLPYNLLLLTGTTVAVLVVLTYYAIRNPVHAVYIYLGSAGVLLGGIVYVLSAYGWIGNRVKTPNDFPLVQVVQFIGWGWLAFKVAEPVPVPLPRLTWVDTDIQQKLSKREWEVYALLTLGHTDQEIADQLFISLNTVKTHVKKIYQKLEVRNRLEAAALSKKQSA